MDQIKNLSIEELGENIEKVTDEEARKKFEDEKFEGSSFLLLNEKDLNDMKIKKGAAKKILKFLKDYSQVSFEIDKNVEQLLSTENQIEIVLSSNIFVFENWAKTKAEIPSTSNTTLITAIFNEEISIPKTCFYRYILIFFR
ncbi:uncharacterized protein [Anoplolepis gracilipes]|uniref:uncharacterized protein n=1 Tax=Anoplolepis gracilipes TaxID=354296 RepID=UPI003BA3D5CB